MDNELKERLFKNWQEQADRFNAHNDDNVIKLSRSINETELKELKEFINKAG